MDGEESLTSHEDIHVLLEVLSVEQLGPVDLEGFDDRGKWFVDVEQPCKAGDVVGGPVDATAGEYLDVFVELLDVLAVVFVLDEEAHLMFTNSL